mgnify:CR=1 FL=1
MILKSETDYKRRSTFRGSCSHTGNVDDGWWNLEFPDPVDIRSVVIYDRTDCCRDRIDGVKVIYIIFFLFFFLI